MGTPTTNYLLDKPTVGGDNDNWGDDAPGTGLNNNMDVIDENLKRVDDLAQAALPADGSEPVAGPLTITGNTAQKGLLVERTPSGKQYLTDPDVTNNTVRFWWNNTIDAIYEVGRIETDLLAALPNALSVVTRERGDARYFQKDGTDTIEAPARVLAGSGDAEGVLITRDTVGDISLYLDSSGKLRVDMDTASEPNETVAIFEPAALLEPTAGSAVITKRIGDTLYLKADSTPSAVFAWATVNGDTGAIKRGVNLSPGTYTVDGEYPLEFDTPPGGGNFAVLITLQTSDVDYNVFANVKLGSKSTAGFTIRTFKSNSALIEVDEIYVQVLY